MSARDIFDVISPEVIAEAVTWRRQLHREPEVAYNERKTSDFIASHLSQFGLAVHRGLAGTGVVGTLKRGVGRRSIAIRADMDALHMQERSGVAHASFTPGIMHACGHDGHVAMALAAARICAGLPDLSGTVHFIFQPAEEGGAGARRMVEEGLFRLFPSDAVYALHNWPSLPLGTCVALDGPMMAANAVFEIEMYGRGCHSAMPQQGADPILAACQLVSVLQSIVSRNVDPTEAAVVSVTQVRAGTDALNVIPDTCVIRGMARWHDMHVGDRVEHRIKELAGSIAAGLSCEAKVRFERRTPATINDPVAASFVRDIVSALPLQLSLVDARPSMASEDFAYMLQAARGCYLWLGAARSADEFGLHSPQYDFNDELMSRGIALWVSLVRQSLVSEHP